jgi:hypothetical protein
MIIMKHILSCTPFTILPKQLLFPSFITPLINNVHLGHGVQEIHLGYVCQERVNQHEWRISHHYTFFNWCICSMAAAYRASIMSLGMMVTCFT